MMSRVKRSGKNLFDPDINIYEKGEQNDNIYVGGKGTDLRGGDNAL